MTPSSHRLPALFLGHGSPMNAIQSNPYTAAWRTLGDALPRPRVILSISAHWYTRGTFVTGNAQPETLYDFGGFPKALSEVRYPAVGDTAFAAEVAQELAGYGASVRTDWGLDHGTWSVLVHMYPRADVPVVQLSIDRNRAPAFHYELGRALAPLRDQGVLILGSGGIVHNLARVDWSNSLPPPGWARQFDDYVQERVHAGDDAPLIDYPSLGESAQLSIPTPDHYLPLLYVLGARAPGEGASIPLTGFDLGTISMTGVQIGVA